MDDVMYDELVGPDLDSARWSPMRWWPSARARCAWIPRFSLSHDSIQSVDSVKYLVFSTRRAVVEPHQPVSFVHVVDSPYEDFDDDFTRLRACEVTLDRNTSTVGWHVDGHKLYEAYGTLVPERARIGFGIYTQLPIRDGHSRSLDGQGMSARWGRFRVSGGAGERNR